MSLYKNKETKKKMDPKVFTTKIDQCHRRWLERELGVAKAEYNGIDHLNEFFAIELKAKLKTKKYSINFAVNADQVDDFVERYPGREFYWAFMTYTFAKTVKETKIKENLEKLVLKREVWSLPWEWIFQFPISNPQHSGPFRYVPIKAFSNIDAITTFKAEKGTIHVK